MSIRHMMHRRGMYIVGDSAYALRGFLLVPYSNAKPGSPEDAFNYFLSCMRISVECAFGEIDRRFGIFWKRLEGDLSSHASTIDSCMRLHNLIVDYREKQMEMGGDIDNERELLDIASDCFVANHPFEILGPHGDGFDEELRLRGRPTNDEKHEREMGVAIRDKLRDEIARNGMSRTQQSLAAIMDRHNRLVELR